MPEIEPKDTSLKSLKGRHLWHAPISSCSQRVRIVLEEVGKDYQSHLIHLDKDEHATDSYQAIHPQGLVPAFVEDGRLFIESIDIIKHIAGVGSKLATTADPELLDMADEAQADLKLLTFEFLFRGGPPPLPENAAAFQAAHKNEWLKQFRRDFSNGFERHRIDAAVNRTAAAFRLLDNLLSDGRPYLSGEVFTVSDIAWMPNVHRFKLMEWPFDRTPYLEKWFERVARCNSYKKALLDWQNEEIPSAFAKYTAKRRAEGTDITAFGELSS